MTKTKCKKRIRKAISDLNVMDNNIRFYMVEDKDCVQLKCQSRKNENIHFGTFSCMEFFDDFADPVMAYRAVMEFVEVISAASRLNDPTAYHNMAS